MNLTPGAAFCGCVQFSCVQVVMAKRIQNFRPARAARPPEMPGFIKPQLATLKSKAPVGPHWLHEIKFDGYRIQIHLNKGKQKVYTRSGLDWAKRFSQIAGVLDIPGQAIIDGEVVVVKGLKRTSTRSVAR